MPSPDPQSLDAFREIPDPYGHIAPRPAPSAIVPDEPSPTRDARQRRTLWAFVLGAAWLALGAAVLGVRKDILSPGALIPILIWAVTASGAVFLAMRPWARGLPLGLRGTQLVLVAVGVIFTSGVLAWSAFGEEALTWKRTRVCLLSSSGLVLGLVVLAAGLFYRSFTNLPALRGAAIGAGLGLMGTTLIHVHCPIPDGAHVLVAHGGAIVFGAVVGAVLGALRGRI